MFKSKLINSSKYYKLRAQLIILFIISSIITAPLIINKNLSTLTIIAIVIAYIGSMVFITKKIKKMDSFIGNQLIEIDDNEIRIKSRKSVLEESIKIANADKIILKKSYGFPQENLKEIANEIKGFPKDNYLIIQQGKEQRRFDFEISSYYMIEKLNKAIEHWTKEGYRIERV